MKSQILGIRELPLLVEAATHLNAVGCLRRVGQSRPAMTAVTRWAETGHELTLTKPQSLS